MATHLSTAVRTAMAQAIITQAGADARMKVYNGTRPAGLDAVTGGNTQLALLTFGTTIGTAGAGAIDWDEAGATQNNATHVAGTPTFVDITTSGNVLVGRLDLGSGSWTMVGTVAPGQNVTLSGLSWAMPHSV